jgi:hypothetical protein
MKLLSPSYSCVHWNPSCSLCSLINRKARAVYPCEAEHSSELSFEIGAIFEDGKWHWEPRGGICSVTPGHLRWSMLSLVATTL